MAARRLLSCSSRKFPLLSTVLDPPARSCSDGARKKSFGIVRPRARGERAQRAELKVENVIHMRGVHRGAILLLVTSLFHACLCWKCQSQLENPANFTTFCCSICATNTALQLLLVVLGGLPVELSSCPLHCSVIKHLSRRQRVCHT